MASSFTCDGCGTPIAVPLRFGVAKPNDYCAACAVHAQAFIDARDRAHRRAVEKFNEKMDASRAGPWAALKVLPDA